MACHTMARAVLLLLVLVLGPALVQAEVDTCATRPYIDGSFK